MLGRRPRPPHLPPSAFDYIKRGTVTRAFVLAALAAAAYSLYRDIEAELRFQSDVGTVLAENIQLMLWRASEFSLQLIVPIALALLVPAFLYDCVARPIRQKRQDRYVSCDRKWRAEVASSIADCQQDSRELKEDWTASPQATAVADDRGPSPATGTSAPSAASHASGGAVTFGFVVAGVGLAFRHVLDGL